MQILRSRRLRFFAMRKILSHTSRRFKDQKYFFIFLVILFNDFFLQIILRAAFRTIFFDISAQLNRVRISQK